MSSGCPLRDKGTKKGRVPYQLEAVFFLSDIDDFRLRENKFRMEHEHKSLRDEVAVLKMKTKAFALERSRSLAMVNITDNY